MSETVGLEREIIGLAMRSQKARADMALVRPEHFQQVQCAAVWKLIMWMDAQGQAVTPQSVLGNLKRIAPTERTGVDGVWLVDCLEASPVAAAAETYAKQLVNQAGITRIQSALLRCQQLAQGATNATELTELVRSEIDSTIPEGQTGIMLGDGLPATIESFREESPVQPTPWHGLNRILGGWRPGALYVVGARPGVGKTLMGLQAAVDLARFGPVAFNSLEMPQQEVHQRILSHATGIYVSKLKGMTNGHSDLTATDWEQIDLIRDTLDGLPLSIDDRSYVTTLDIRTHARSLTRRGPLAGIVVDYLQLMGTPRGDRRPRHEVVASMSRDLKLLAKEMQCPVIALSQLNRQSEQRGSRGPSLADLRESGAIEQDADVVILLDVPTNSEGEPDESSLNVLVAKNRHGEANKGIRLRRQGWISTLADIERTF